MRILGVSAFYHDSAAAIIINGEIIAAAQEERFTRKKHDASFPINAIQFCLEYSRMELSDIDCIVFYDKPLLKFERLLETYYAFAPKGVKSFIMSMPVWLKEKLFLKRAIKDELAKIGSFNNSETKMLFPEHHLSHAASAFYPSNFQDSAILTIDGVGEWATTSICYGNGKDIKIIKELRFPHSLGLLYSAFTYYLGFKVNSGEYKLMGLAPYGIEDSVETAKFRQIIKDHLVKVNLDGSISLNQKYFTYATGTRMVPDKKWMELFGIPRRDSESELKQVHCNMALAIQKTTEEIVLKLAHTAKELTGSKNLCLAGGVALNCVANGVLQGENIFENIFIQPAAGDAGGALGAALVAHHIYYGGERKVTDSPDQMKGSYLGPQFTNDEIEASLRKLNASYQYYTEFTGLAGKVAELIEKGNVIGWMQGRMEFGPRALGARSILGDARNTEMQLKLNLKIKYRESFRPFAPSVMEEHCEDYFEGIKYSPYMLMVKKLKEKRLNGLPDDYQSLKMKDKLYIQRSDIPAITHVDNSARIQTVSKLTNPKYWELLNQFKKRTGETLVVNTSFNVRGEPIVCTPEDSYQCFMRTEMDYLVIGDFLLKKEDQPKWDDAVEWEKEFVLD